MAVSAPPRRYQNYINGQFRDAEGGKTTSVENPSTRELISEVPDSSLEDVREAIACAEQAQSGWEGLAPNDRAQYMHRVADILRRDAATHGRVIAEEQGKIIEHSVGEAELTAEYMDYMAEWARRLEGEIVTSDRPMR